MDGYRYSLPNAANYENTVCIKGAGIVSLNFALFSSHNIYLVLLSNSHFSLNLGCTELLPRDETTYDR